MSDFHYTPDIIRQMQLVELDMLREVTRLCHENDIGYIIDGGTLLGAVRHGGFIPWDDDVDIRMLREEYEKFCEICKTQLDTEKYFLQTYNTDDGYRWGYARMLRIGSFFDRRHQEMLTMKRGIFIDIFPCDGMPDDGWRKKYFNLRCMAARKIAYSAVGARYAPNFFIRMIYRLLNAIPVKVAHNEFERLSRLYEKQPTKSVRILGWSEYADEHGLKRDWLTDRVTMKFENLTVYAPRDYDGFLRHMFGDDYMTLPPIEQRQPKHTALMITFPDE